MSTSKTHGGAAHGSVKEYVWGLIWSVILTAIPFGLVMSGALDSGLTLVIILLCQAILVSIDPKRDTPEKLAKYAEFFHPNLVGITGSQDEIDTVTKQYGAFYNFTEIESVSLEYGVEHSSRYYVIDQQGKLVTAMRHSTTPNELFAQIIEVQEKG